MCGPGLHAPCAGSIAVTCIQHRPTMLSVPAAEARPTQTSYAWTPITSIAVTTPATLKLRGMALEAAKAAQQDLPPWRDFNLPLTDRLADLVASFTLDEKLSLMANGQAAVDRLDIPAYQFWTGAVHVLQLSAGQALCTKPYITQCCCVASLYRRLRLCSQNHGSAMTTSTNCQHVNISASVCACM